MQRNLRFALFGNTYQEHKSAHVTHLLEILRGKGAEICISNEFYDFLPKLLMTQHKHAIRLYSNKNV